MISPVKLMKEGSKEGRLSLVSSLYRKENEVEI